MGAFGYWMGNHINLRGHREGMVKMRAYYKGKAVTEGYDQPTNKPVVLPLTKKESRRRTIRIIIGFTVALLFAAFAAKLLTIAF